MKRKRTGAKKMATEKKQRVRYTQEHKEQAYKLFDQNLSMVEIARQTGIGEMTLAQWKRDRAREEAEEVETSAVELLKVKELELELERLQNKYLRRYSRPDIKLEQRLELEINYLIEFAKVFCGEWEVKRLSEAAAAEEEEEGD